MKRLTFMAVCFAMALALQAQPGEGQVHERIEAQRVAFLTNRLSLTPEEAQQFWPVFNEYRKGMKEVRKDKRPDKAAENMTDKEADEFLADAINAEEREFALRKDLVQKLRKFLPSRKIVLLFQAEEEFKRQLLREVGERRGNRGGGPRKEQDRNGDND